MDLFLSAPYFACITSVDHLTGSGLISRKEKSFPPHHLVLIIISVQYMFCNSTLALFVLQALKELFLKLNSISQNLTFETYD